MTDFDRIRGKKPTKTELILNYLVQRQGEILNPKQVAEDLGFNLQTTVTVLNRLALEGAISKKGRGQFAYEMEGEQRRKSPGKEEEKGPSLETFDKNTARMIFDSIYNMASESAGEDVIGTIAGISRDDFDEREPVKSIKNLVRALIDLLGEEIADDIVSIAVESEASNTIGVKKILTS